jgi:hypothetical protein
MHILQSILPVHRGTRPSACGTRPSAQRDPPVSLWDPPVSLSACRTRPPISLRDPPVSLSACGTRPLDCQLQDPPVSLHVPGPARQPWDPLISPAGPARQPAGPACQPAGPARQPACLGTRSSAMGPARQPSHGTRLSAQVDQLQGLPMGPTRMPWTHPWDPPVSHGARLPGPLDPLMSGSVGGIHRTRC